MEETCWNFGFQEFFYDEDEKFDLDQCVDAIDLDDASDSDCDHESDDNDEDAKEEILVQSSTTVTESNQFFWK